MNSVAKACGIPESSLRQYSKGTIPRADSAIKLAVFFEVDLFELMTGAQQFLPAKGASLEQAGRVPLEQGSATEPKEKEHGLPLIGMAACDITGWEQTTSMQQRMPWLSRLSEEAFAVIAKGESLTPMGLVDGMICYCDPSYELCAGDIIYIEKLNKKGLPIASLKRFNEFTEISGHKAISVVGWKEDKTVGHQEPIPHPEILQPNRYKSYHLDLDIKLIKRFAPVVYVRRKL